MKKLYILIGLVALFAMGQAQDKWITEKSGYAFYTGTDADTCIYGSTWDVVFFVELAAKSRYTISHTIIADTMATSTANVTIQLYGSYDGVTYSTVGSAITWSAGSAVYAANVNLNTFTELMSGTQSNASHTEVTAAHIITASDSIIYSDTLNVAAQTNTVGTQTITDARTGTTTLPGVDYRYLKLLFTAASGGTAEIDYVGIKVTPITF